MLQFFAAEIRNAKPHNSRASDMTVTDRLPGAVRCGKIDAQSGRVDQRLIGDKTVTSLSRILIEG